MIDNSELSYYLALQYAPTIGPSKFIKLIKTLPSLKELFNLSKVELANLGIKDILIEYLHNPDWNAVEKNIAWRERAGNHHIITWRDENYPKQLHEIHAAPPLLYVKGNVEVLQSPQLAIVGTRHPTTIGSDVAYQFAEHLANKGLTITSGLAIGIDGISHRGALASKGKTVAVLGSGLDNIYPNRHKVLAEQICEQGAVISEFPTQEAPEAGNFPRRNRIISGLSLGILIVEAAVQSGSLITAKYALEQGREVFAIPGSIHNPLAKGCHALIKQGAKLVETSADIFEELSSICPFLGPSEQTNPSSPLDLAALDTHYRKLVDCIEFATTPMDVIIHRSGLAAEAVSSMVLMLELQGYIQAVNGGYIRL